MLTKGTGFARYSRNLCWIVAGIFLAIAGLTFTGDSANSMVIGVLWLLGAGAFAISALFMSKGASEPSREEAASSE